jgi:hypothetical protein
MPKQTHKTEKIDLTWIFKTPADALAHLGYKRRGAYSFRKPGTNTITIRDIYEDPAGQLWGLLSWESNQGKISALYLKEFTQDPAKIH